MIANIITGSRILLSLSLFVISPTSISFTLLYLLCGVTDVLDGFLARKLHMESEKGAMLDSAVDLLFAVVYAVRILPLLSVPLWIWIWIAIIAVTKVSGILIASKKAHKLSIEHSLGNKITGLLLFLLPLSVWLIDVKCSAALVCAVATVATAEELFSNKLSIKNS